jgi:mono/diheme cytochrome c family protein
VALGGLLAAVTAHAAAGTPPPALRPDFEKEVRPILVRYCFDCHGDGADKGGVRLDAFVSAQAMRKEHGLWLDVLKNVRAGMMPPARKPQPSEAERQVLEAWIKADVFQTDLRNLDPGRVTVRRLNRVEYRNTIRALLGVEFDTTAEFPPDDTGRGFDNIADVLTVSPMLLEKYLAAARTIVDRTVPVEPFVPARTVLPGREFRRSVPLADSVSGSASRGSSPSPVGLSFYEPAVTTNALEIGTAGKYRLEFDLSTTERFVDNQFDYNRCRLILRADGEELLSKEFTREGNRPFHFEFERDWKPGKHTLAVEVQPLTPGEKQVRSLAMRVDSVSVQGPMERSRWVRPPGYSTHFPKDPPNGASARRTYARELLTPFVRKAFRRPADRSTLDRLVSVAESTWKQPGKSFESGIAQAMVAVLASPRFLFREESALPAPGRGIHPPVDEFALASRLSYFLWSSMPDEELFRLASQGRLRAELESQVVRMQKDPRFGEFVRNFAGQWLQTRDIESTIIDARQVLAREAAPDPELEQKRLRFRELRDRNPETLSREEKKELEELRPLVTRRFSAPLRADLTWELRRSMRQETEACFEHVVREDRSLLELIESDYTFLNERLAAYYGLTNLNVVGDAIRRVVLPPDSPRGGLLTQGTLLVVTSNPTRTSPVKRGLFILDNILGTPPPPPPAAVPPLEDAAKAMKEKTLTLRETLALHRGQPLCSSCHNRMDPLGLALENFNAMGLWRDTERGMPVDASGSLLSGESFRQVRELKHILATRHSVDFYRTVSEKMLTYALGRGLDYYDVPTLDALVERLVQSGGRPGVLLSGIIESVPFQNVRATERVEPAIRSKETSRRAPARIQP